MSRVDSNSNVQVGGELTFIENESSRGIIRPFKWDLGQTHEAMILKIATDGERGFINGKLPSWVFAEEYLGMKPSIQELGEMGHDFTYKVSESAEKNIIDTINAKGIQILANSKLANLELIPEVKALAEKVREAQRKAKKEAKREAGEDGIDEIPMEEIDLGDKIELTDELRKVIEEDIIIAKKAFIRERTQIRLAMANVVGTKVDGTFKQGSIPKPEVDPEPEKVARKLANVSLAMTRGAFEESTGETARDTENYKKLWSKYRYTNAPMTHPGMKSAIFAVTGNVVYNDETGYTYIPNPKTKQPVGLNYIEVSSNEKFAKFQTARLRPKTDTELDYVAVRLEYTNGDDKMAAGRLFSIVSHEERIPDKDIFNLFLPAIPSESYKKTYLLMDYPIEEIASTMTQWIADNQGLIEKIKGEDLEKLGDALQEFGIGGMTSDALEDLMEDIKKEQVEVNATATDATKENPNQDVSQGGTEIKDPDDIIPVSPSGSNMEL